MSSPSSRFLSYFIATMSFMGCTRFDILNSTVPSRGYIRTSNIPYANLPRQQLDIYVPRKAPPATPVVIFFYGGNWQQGEKSDYRFVAQALTSKGFIAVLPNYRLYPSVTFPDFVNDGALAIRWVHDNIAHFNGNPNCVFLMGHSAGAHIAALLNLDPHYLRDVGITRSAIRATVGLSGPYDFVPSPPDRPVFSMSPTDTSPNPNIEPIHFVDGHAPPILLIQGLADKTVDPGNALRLTARIRQAGGSVRCLMYPGVAHVGVVQSFAGWFRWISPALKDSTRFIHEQEQLPAFVDRPPTTNSDIR